MPISFARTATILRVSVLKARKPFLLSTNLNLISDKFED